MAELHVERVASLDELHADWNRLAEATGSPFATWEWASAWWQAFGRGRQLLIHVARRDDGEVMAILPLYVASRYGRARLARFIGHGPADQLGPVCAPASRPAAALAVRRIVRHTLGPASMLLADRLPIEENWRPMLGGRTLRRESSPVLRTEGLDWDGWLATKSRNFRDQIRRRERKLSKEYDVSLQLVVNPEEVRAGFETLVELHEARWTGASRAFAGTRLDFHRDFALRAAKCGWTRLWLLRVDGRPAAAWYGLRFGTADWYYQAGRAPELERANVGFVLLSHTIRDAFLAGRREYRFLLGDEAYKSRFASSDLGLETVAVSAGPAAIGAQAASYLATSLPSDARRRIARRVA